MSRALFALALGLALAAGGADGLRDWVARTDLPPLAVPVGTEVLARDGSLLRAFQVADGRWRLAPGPVDAGFLGALVAYEDRRFYAHGGVDLRAIARAAVQAALAGRVVSGASTLSMQVARLLEEGPTGQLAGKIRQARVALALEARLSKAEILDLYLRLAPYGGNLEGVRAAALAWFGKEPRRLSTAETALLIALTHGWVDPAPILRDALVSFDCVVDEMMVAHSHAVMIGEIKAVQMHPGGHAPLLYADGRYTTLHPHGDPTP